MSTPFLSSPRSSPALLLPLSLLCALAMLCLLPSCRTLDTAPEEGQVCGVVTYRERMALPEDAVIRVRLQDVSRQDDVALLLGEQTITPQPGQVPVPFCVPYLKSAIDQRRTYAVSAEIHFGGRRQFVSDTAHQVLTRGNAATADITLRRVTPPPTLRDKDLPATWSGTLPCADCPGIDTVLTLRPGGAAMLRTTYRERDNTVTQPGRWTLRGQTLTLTSGSDTPRTFMLTGNGALHMLGASGMTIHTDQNQSLVRDTSQDAFIGSFAMRGMFRYMADAASMTLCGQEKPIPVAMAEEYVALERAYLSVAPAPGQPVLVKLAGRLEQRPAQEGDGTTEMIVVERFEQIRPRERCDTVAAPLDLLGTQWTLIALGGNPFVPGPGKLAPFVRFDPYDNQVSGFAGCNRLLGQFDQSGQTLLIDSLGITKRSCAVGMKLETVFLEALRRTTSYDLQGNELALIGGGKELARFRAQAP